MFVNLFFIYSMHDPIPSIHAFHLIDERISIRRVDASNVRLSNMTREFLSDQVVHEEVDKDCGKEEDKDCGKEEDKDCSREKDKDCDTKEDKDCGREEDKDCGREEDKDCGREEDKDCGKKEDKDCGKEEDKDCGREKDMLYTAGSLNSEGQKELLNAPSGDSDEDNYRDVGGGIRSTISMSVLAETPGSTCKDGEDVSDCGKIVSKILSGSSPAPGSTNERMDSHEGLYEWDSLSGLSPAPLCTSPPKIPMAVSSPLPRETIPPLARSNFAPVVPSPLSTQSVSGPTVSKSQPLKTKIKLASSSRNSPSPQPLQARGSNLVSSSQTSLKSSKNNITPGKNLTQLAAARGNISPSPGGRVTPSSKGPLKNATSSSIDRGLTTLISNRTEGTTMNTKGSAVLGMLSGIPKENSTSARTKASDQISNSVESTKCPTTAEKFVRKVVAPKTESIQRPGSASLRETPRAKTTSSKMINTKGNHVSTPILRENSTVGNTVKPIRLANVESSQTRKPGSVVGQPAVYIMEPVTGHNVTDMPEGLLRSVHELFNGKIIYT